MKYLTYQSKFHGRYDLIRSARGWDRLDAMAQLLGAGCKRVVGHPLYLISPTGDVYSTRNSQVIKMHPGTKRAGYRYVAVHRDPLTGKQTVLMVHRIVAEAFLPNPLNLPYVNHKNGIKGDNRVENLEWCSPLENSSHAVSLGRIKRGSEHGLSKLTADQVRLIRRAEGTYKRIAQEFGICAQTVCNVKLRRVYGDVS